MTALEWMALDLLDFRVGSLNFLARSSRLSTLPQCHESSVS